MPGGSRVEAALDPGPPKRAGSGGRRQPRAERPTAELAAAATDVLRAGERLVAAQAERLGLASEDVARRCMLQSAVVHGVMLLAGAALVLMALGLGQLLATSFAWPPGAAWIGAGFVLGAVATSLSIGGSRLMRRRRLQELRRRMARRSVEASAANREAQDAEELLQGELAEAREDLSSSLGAAIACTVHSMDPRAWVRRRPLASLGAAAAVGLAGGMLTASRREAGRDEARRDAHPPAAGFPWMDLLLPLLEAWTSGRRERPRPDDG